VRRNRAAADIGIQVVLRIVNLGLGVVVTLVLVRSLGPDGFGQWATVFAVADIVGYLSELGLEQLAVRRAAAEPEREAEWIGALITVRTVIAVPVVLVSMAVLLPISASSEMQATAVLICAAFFAGGISGARAVFQLRVRNDISMLIVTLNSVLWGAAVVAIASGDGSMVAYAVAFLVTLVLTNSLYYFVAIRMAPIHLRGSSELWRPLLVAGVPLGLAGLLTMAYVRIDGVLVYAIEGAGDAGIYSAVYRVLDRIQFLPAAVMTTLFPLIAAAWPRERDRAHRLVQLAIDYLGIAALPALGFTVVAAEPVVELLFGDEFVRGAPALPILMGAFIALAYYQLALSVTIVLGLQRRLVAFAAVGLVVNVLLNLALIPVFGYIAAAWVTLVTEALVAWLALRMAFLKMEVRPQPTVLWRAVLAALAMSLATLGLRELGAPLAALVSGAAVTYGAGLLVTRAVTVRDVIALVRRQAV
jgi:O-antigen/teichoic acid export membrane protein